MRSETPILELAMAVADPQLDLAMNVPLSLRLQPGECTLIEAADFRQLVVFADLCGGLIEPRSGEVRFLGRDWRTLPDDHAAAMRGRIGRVFTHGAWVPLLMICPQADIQCFSFLFRAVLDQNTIFA